MTNWLNLLVAGIIIAGYALFMWKLWPVLKENAMAKKAMNIVYLMEETFGGGTGLLKFDTAVEMMQEWLDRRHWNIDVQTVKNIVLAAVGALHAEQGELPPAQNGKVPESGK